MFQHNVGLIMRVSVLAIYLITLIIFKLVSKNKSERFVFNGLIIIQFIILGLSWAQAFIINGPVTMEALYIGIPFVIVEKIMGMILVKANNTKRLKALMVVGTIVTAIIVIITGRFPANGGNVPTV